MNARLLLWAQFYAGVMSFQYHPGNPREKRMPFEEGALIADIMLAHAMERSELWD